MFQFLWSLSKNNEMGNDQKIYNQNIYLDSE